MIRQPDLNDKPGNDPVREILNLIRALPPADLDRLMRQLELWPAERLAGCAIVPRRLLDTLAHAVRVGLRGCVDAATRARQFRKTHQPKRGPSQETLDLLQRIKKMRADKVKWPLIDRRLGVRPNRAREIWNDGRRRGWI